MYHQLKLSLYVLEFRQRQSKPHSCIVYYDVYFDVLFPQFIQQIVSR